MDQKWIMYILVKEDIPLGLAMAAVGHASIACYRKFEGTVAMNQWLEPGQFRKVVCKVTEKEFEKAKEEDSHVVMTESALNNAETAIAFCPRTEYPKRFKFLKLYREA